jgi:hypothetical protein
LGKWENFFVSQEARFKAGLSSAKTPEQQKLYKDALNSFANLRSQIQKTSDELMGEKIAPFIPKGKLPSAREEEQIGLLTKIMNIKGLPQAALNVATGGKFSGIQAAGHMFRSFSKIAGKTAEVDRIIDVAAKGVANTSKVIGKAAIVGTSQLAASESTSNSRRKSEYERTRAIKKQLANFSSIINDPLTYGENLQAQMPELAQMAPKITQSIIETKTKAGAFLLLKASEIGLNSDPRGVNIRESQSKLYKMEKYIEAVNNPVAQIKKLKTGTMSNEAAEVLKNVYPTLYKATIDAVQQRVSEQKGAHSSDLSRQLSVLLDYPFDPMYSPEIVQAFQAIHAVAGGMPGDVAGRQSGRPQNISNIKRTTQLREDLTTGQQQEAR